MMKLIYTVHSADEVAVQRDVEIDGQTVAATVPGVSVQLTSPHGSIFLNLAGPLAEGHPFVVGKEIPVQFGGKA